LVKIMRGKSSFQGLEYRSIPICIAIRIGFWHAQDDIDAIPKLILIYTRKKLVQFWVFKSSKRKKKISCNWFSLSHVLTTPTTLTTYVRPVI